MRTVVAPNCKNIAVGLGYRHVFVSVVHPNIGNPDPLERRQILLQDGKRLVGGFFFLPGIFKKDDRQVKRFVERIDAGKEAAEHGCIKNSQLDFRWRFPVIGETEATVPG